MSDPQDHTDNPPTPHSPDTQPQLLNEDLAKSQPLDHTQPTLDMQ